MSLSMVISVLLSPLFAFLIYLYVRYRYKDGKFTLFYQSFFGGIISVIIPVCFFGAVYLAGYTELGSLRRILFYSFVVIGFSQELGKFLVLRFMVLPSKYFRGPSDGILYSLMINFGSMSLITLISFIFFKEIEISIIIYSIFISVVFATLLGFFVGLGKARHNLIVDSITGFFAAAFFHGSFQFIIQTKDMILLFAFITGSIIITLLLVYKAVLISDQIKKNKSIL